MRVVLPALALSLVLPAAARAEPIVDRPLVTEPGKDIRVGAYAVFKQDCSGGVAADIRPAGDQTNGVLVISTGRLATTRLAHCGRVEAPARIVTYRPNPGFVGTDSATYDVVDPTTGKKETHAVSVSVAR